MRLKLEYSGCLDGSVMASGCHAESLWWALTGLNNVNTMLFVLPRKDIRQLILNIGVFRFAFMATGHAVDLYPHQGGRLGRWYAMPLIMSKAVSMTLAYNGTARFMVNYNWRIGTPTKSPLIYSSIVEKADMPEFCHIAATRVCQQMADYSMALRMAGAL